MALKRHVLYLVILTGPLSTLFLLDLIRNPDLAVVVGLIMTAVVGISLALYGSVLYQEGRRDQYKEISPALRIEED